METFVQGSREGTDVDVHYRIVLPDGTTKHVEVGQHPVSKLSSETGEYVGFLTVVTECRRAEEERERLRQTQADLARINRVSTMGELTASLADEIKQPISAGVKDAKTCSRFGTKNAPMLIGYRGDESTSTAAGGYDTFRVDLCCYGLCSKPFPAYQGGVKGNLETAQIEYAHTGHNERCICMLRSC